MAEIKATGEPRFAVFDFEYDSGEGLRKRIAFINWYVSSSRYTALRPILSIAGHPMRIHASLCAPIDTLPCVSRIKDDMPVRLKMLYASSKDNIRKKLDGLQAELQCTDEDEIEYQTGVLLLS